MANSLPVFSVTPPYYCSLAFGPYERPSPFEDGKWKREFGCYLPLPSQLGDLTAVSVSGSDQGTVGDIFNGDWAGAAASAGLSKLGDIGAAGVQAIGGLTKILPGTSLSNLGSKLASGMDFKQFQSAIEQSLGVAPNPNPSVTFEGPVLGDFSFDWTLNPSSPEESIRVQTIINKIKELTLPKFKFGQGRSAILSYPHLCQINFYPWDKGGSGTNGWSDSSIIRIKRCMVTSVNANYTPGNTPAFFEGTTLPVSIQLSIQMKEVEYRTAHDYGASVGEKQDPISGVFGELGKAITDAVQ